MSCLLLTINYNNSLNFSYDNTKIDVSTYAELLLENNTGQIFNQNFSAAAGFTYNASYTEFVAGQVQQKSQRPANATFGATYTSSINGSWGNGTLTGTAAGGAAILGNKLDLAHNDLRYVDYSATANADSQQVGAIKFKLTPNYTGSPASINVFVSICKAGGDGTNRIDIFHEIAGTLKINIYDQSNVLISNATYGAWAPTSGVTYEFEFNYDLTAGANRLFIDGTQSGGTDLNTGTRDANIGLLRIGSTGISGTQTSNFSIEDLVIFNAVQHTGNYASGYSLSEYDYLEDLISLPQFSYSGLGNIQEYTNFAETGSGTYRYNVNGKYWNGGSWVASDDSYAQMNDAATVIANISTLTAIDTVDINIRTIDGNVQGSVTDLTVTYTGEQYNTTTPTIISNTGIYMDGICSFTETASKPGTAEIRYTFLSGSQDYYYNGAIFTTSNGTYAQANIATTIETNKAAFAAAGLKGLFKVKGFLYSDGTTTPQLTTVNLGFDFYVVSNVSNDCIVYGWVYDHDNEPLSGITVEIYNTSAYQNRNNLLLAAASTTTDINGYWEISATETETISKTVNVKFSGTIGGTPYEKIYTGVIIPDETSMAFNNIAID